jgi:hypothetical protein
MIVHYSITVAITNIETFDCASKFIPLLQPQPDLDYTTRSSQVHFFLSKSGREGVYLRDTPQWSCDITVFTILGRPTTHQPLPPTTTLHHTLSSLHPYKPGRMPRSNNTGLAMISLIAAGNMGPVIGWRVDPNPTTLGPLLSKVPLVKPGAAR